MSPMIATLSTDTFQPSSFSTGHRRGRDGQHIARSHVTGTRTERTDRDRRRRRNITVLSSTETALFRQSIRVPLVPERAAIVSLERARPPILRGVEPATWGTIRTLSLTKAPREESLATVRNPGVVSPRIRRHDRLLSLVLGGCPPSRTRLHDGPGPSVLQ